MFWLNPSDFEPLNSFSIFYCLRSIASTACLAALAPYSPFSRLDALCYLVRKVSKRVSFWMPGLSRGIGATVSGV
jgi:hypothetical protein